MSYAPFNTDDLPFKRFFGYSAFFHGALTVILIVGVWVQRTANPWGGIGGADSGVKVNLVGGAGIPMPQPTVPSESETVDPTKGLHKEEPKPPEPKTDATKIPKFDKNKPLPPSKASKTFEAKTPPPENAVPYGKGGQMNLPSGSGVNPGPIGGGMSVQGSGGGDFAGRYPWYVDSVRKRISENWLQNTIDPAIRSARTAHAVVTFTILRDGTVQNIRLDQSSGNRSMDDSAMRALLSIEKMPALPSDWRGTVNVTFDFDLAQHH